MSAVHATRLFRPFCIGHNPAPKQPLGDIIPLRGRVLSSLMTFLCKAVNDGWPAMMYLRQIHLIQPRQLLGHDWQQP